MLICHADVPDVGTQMAVRTIEELSQLVTEFLSAKFHDLFYRIMMHHKISSDQVDYFANSLISNICAVQSNSLGYHHQDQPPTHVSTSPGQAFVTAQGCLFRGRV